jgi:hypothetical protein
MLCITLITGDLDRSFGISIFFSGSYIMFASEIGYASGGRKPGQDAREK